MTDFPLGLLLLQSGPIALLLLPHRHPTYAVTSPYQLMQYQPLPLHTMSSTAVELRALAPLSPSMNTQGTPHYLAQGLTQFSQDALLVKHLALVAVLVVVMDPLAHVGGELVEGHVLLHLFVLRRKKETSKGKTLPGHNAKGHLRCLQSSYCRRLCTSEQISDGGYTCLLHADLRLLCQAEPGDAEANELEELRVHSHTSHKWLPHVLTLSTVSVTSPQSVAQRNPRHIFLVTQDPLPTTSPT